MKTKQDLLDKMKVLGACDEATDYVQSSKANTAATIWKTCDRFDWLCWFAFHIRPDLAPDFAFKQADIAARVHAVSALRSAGLTDKADKLAALPVIDSMQAARSAADAAFSARSAAYSAYWAADAAYAAAYSARSAYSAYAAYAAYAAYSADAVATYAADAAAYLARSAASAARSAAAYSADAAAYSAAHSDQLKELHAMWPQISGDDK